MGRRSDDLFKTVLQIAAILGLLLMCLVILHKGVSDVMALARQHSGVDFWPALVRHVLRNLAGG